MKTLLWKHNRQSRNTGETNRKVKSFSKEIEDRRTKWQAEN